MSVEDHTHNSLMNMIMSKKHNMGSCSISLPLIPLLMVTTIALVFGVTLQIVTSSPLHTTNRWIVDEGGKRVKLACVNWVSHLDTMVAEGLSQQPLNVISKRIKTMGFNCVRLTWPIFLLTNDSLSSLTVRNSFKNLGLLQYIPGFQTNNPSIIDLPLIKAYQAVVKSLGDNDVMAILDNHVTKPGWCCGESDGNGFFGDQFFDPDLWIKGLTKMATTFKGVTNVVAMSLRNELRGPKQNVYDWYRYMPKGAEAVHGANPDVLVILSGLNFDTDLSFIGNKSVILSFNGKLVFELHWYGFSDGQAWMSGNSNQVCGLVTGKVMRNAGFLLGLGWPLFVSEFGIDMRAQNINDNRYLNCFMALAAQLDLDWALWTLVGSYYIRVAGTIEYYGILNPNWNQVRNTGFLQRISSIQLPFQGPGLPEAVYKVIFHPLTGLCILRNSVSDPLRLGHCSNSEAWDYTNQQFLSIKGTSSCLQAEGEGKEAKLGNTCLSQNAKWEMISDSKMHLSTKVNNSFYVCLDVDTNNAIVTNTCNCLSNDNKCDPSSQWFKLVDTTRKSTTLTLSKH
ncbi:glycosyl hydrolase 5 family protein-like [Abrus precatorius]|uniref:Glycosyl hydrolase 5 family protein-like n=1 Tax=Abrus precatorius TaxID=3816 RepID=A0A8B8K2E4_ABRPR|nr:glycosyl hydrolase 5 family protein-like [Abrus precatorius]